MNIYKIPVTWREYGYVIVEAKDETEAVKLAHDADLPIDSAYLEDSFEIDYGNITKI